MTEVVTDRVPSSQRLVPGSVNIPMAVWPTTADIEEATINAIAVSSKIIDSFNQTLENKDYRALAELFLEGGYWRDQLALTWDFRTAKGRDAIQNLLQQGHHLIKVDIDNSPTHGPQLVPMRYDGSVRGILFYTLVTTKDGSGRGTVRLIRENGTWKIWAMTTVMLELNDHKEALGPNRPLGVQHGAEIGRENVGCPP
jgi:hypothetical protein